MRLFFAGLVLAIGLGAVAQDVADPASASRAMTAIEVIERVTLAIDRGLEYLARRQLPDGRWAGNNGVDGPALLAFLGRGHVPGRGPYHEIVERAKLHILSTQREDGYLASAMGTGRMYGHALATLAMSEVYGMDPEPRVESCVRKAVDLIVAAQSPNGGWRYNPAPGDHDLSVTVMQIVALRAANNAEIPVPEETIKKAIGYVHACNHPENGGFSYQPGGGASAQMTAAGVPALITGDAPIFWYLSTCHGNLNALPKAA